MTFYFTDTYTLILIFSSFVFALFVFFDKNRMMLLVEYMLNQKYTLLYHRKDSLIYNGFMSINTLIIFSIIISFYLFHDCEEFGLYSLLKIILVLLLFFCFKTTIVYFLGLTFELKNYAKKYQHGYSTSLLLISVVFFPLILFVSYTKSGFLLATVSEYVFYLWVVFCSNCPH